jgi:hypothetical protein
VNTGYVAKVCPNCGAPLDLDPAGACRWCHARIRTEPTVVSVLQLRSLVQDRVSLVPADVDDCGTSAPFLALALSTLGLLGGQPAVKEYMDREPRLLQQIQALSMSVSAAGVRVRDEGLLKDSFDSNLEVYTHEEIWTFDLAFDIIAVIGSLDGLSGQTRARVTDNLRTLAWYSDRHHWKKAVKKAGEGPVAWHELRAWTPHRG